MLGQAGFHGKFTIERVWVDSVFEQKRMIASTGAILTF